MKKFNFLSKSSSRSCGHSSVTLASTVGSPSAHSRSTMLKLLSVLVLILTIGVGQMWGADYTITFANNVNSAAGLTASTQASTAIASASRGYVISSPFTVNAGNCYYGDTQSCIRLGKSGNDASLSIALSDAGQVSATTIVVNCERMSGDKNASATISVNGATAQAAPASADDLTFTINDDITSITLTSVTAVKVFSITVNYSTTTLSSISVKTPPAKIKYLAGEYFAPASLVITEHYDDNSTADVAYSGNEDKFAFSPATNVALTTSNTAVTITYATKTVNQSINVYSVTVQVVDEDGTPLSGVGMPSASATARNITASAKGNNYVFKTWEFDGSNNGLSFGTATNASTTLSGTPTGNVTIKAVYHKPIAVTWKVNGKAWTPNTPAAVGKQNGTAEVGYNEQVSTLPTDPTTAEFCGQKFMGWTKTEIGSTGLTDAAAISALNLFTTAGGSPSITTETTFHAVFADYGEE